MTAAQTAHTLPIDEIHIRLNFYRISQALKIIDCHPNRNTCKLVQEDVLNIDEAKGTLRMF